jgi:hypothetical protein
MILFRRWRTTANEIGRIVSLVCQIAVFEKDVTYESGGEGS